MTPEAAKGEAEGMRIAILKDLLGNDDWKNEGILLKIPFTRSMLIKFLATVTEHRTKQSSPSSSLSLGEIWWERVR